MANIAPLVSTRGPIYAHLKGIVKRTTCHTLALYGSQLGNHVGKADLQAGNLWHGGQSVPMIDAIATVRSGKTWSIALVNRHFAKNVSCTILIKGTLLDGRYEATILAGDSTDAFNGVEHPNHVEPRRTELSFKKGIVSLQSFP